MNTYWLAIESVGTTGFTSFLSVESISSTVFTESPVVTRS